MNDMDDNTKNDDIGYVEDVTRQENLVSQDAVQEKHINKSRKSKFKIIYIFFAVLLVLSLLLASWYMLNKGDGTKDASSDQTTKSSEKNETIEKIGNIPKTLFQMTQSREGIALGYVEKEPNHESSLLRNLFIGRASAHQDEYDTVLFFKDSEGAISMLNTVTKEISKIVDEKGSSLVFSSVGQKLAYIKDDGCSVSLFDFDLSESNTILNGSVTFQDTINDEIEDEEICFSPISWSPNGNKLLLKGVYSVNNQEAGLMSINRLYIYDIETKAVEKLLLSEDDNSNGTYAYWLDDVTILSSQEKRDTAFVAPTEELVTINIKDTTHIVTKFDADIALGTVQVIGNVFYAYSESNTSLVMGSCSEPSKISSLGAISGGGTFLVTSKGSSYELFTIDGTAGEENSFTLNKTVVSTGERVELHKPEGYSAYMLGWGSSYDEIIYMNVPSGKNEIHQYSISSDVDTLMVDDLSFIQ